MLQFIDLIRQDARPLLMKTSHATTQSSNLYV